MIVRLRRARRIARDTYRVSLDIVDPGRPPWDLGDCMVQVDVVDQPGHDAMPRGLLGPAVELYKLSPDEPPNSPDSRLLWEIGQAVRRFVGRLFDAGVFCPFSEQPKDGSAGRAE